ncbi:hypothetical protein EDC01DRAFT_720134 [Geopyxis carbonaria]|nr:hypothetical protein EDC01DRAFT_720134 [Geopyxis carbonaria]
MFTVTQHCLEGRYVFNHIPLGNALVFLSEILGISYVIWTFEQNFRAKPVLTTMITNSILNGVADTVAQTVTAVRQRKARQKALAKKDGISIEIHDLSEKSLPTHRADLYNIQLFDVERLVRFMSWGFLMAPIQLQWFQLLSEWFPITELNKTTATIWRVLVDQVFFSPIGLGLFFIFMTVAEGGRKNAVMRKLNHVFLPALKSNYVLWPAVQLINFRIISLPLQLPFASTIGICWTTYLSLKNDAVDA